MPGNDDGDGGGTDGGEDKDDDGEDKDDGDGVVFVELVIKTSFFNINIGYSLILF